MIPLLTPMVASCRLAGGFDRARRLDILAALAAGLMAMATPWSLAQNLVGCRLVEATLQCLPGVDASPQQQIQIMKGEIGADLQMEALVEQRIAGLQQVILEGEALEGSLLRTRLAMESGGSLGTVSYHWYRHAPGRNSWELIPSAQGDSYVISRDDIAYDLMVVVVVATPVGPRRIQSAPVGPVRVLQPVGDT